MLIPDKNDRDLPWWCDATAYLVAMLLLLALMLPYASHAAIAPTYDTIDRPGNGVWYANRPNSNFASVAAAVAATNAYWTGQYGSQCAVSEAYGGFHISLNAYRRTNIRTGTVAQPTACSGGDYTQETLLACPSGYQVNGSDALQCISTTPTCPANSTLSGGTCVCNSGYNEENGACVLTPVPCPSAGTTVQGYISAGSSPGQVCFNQCAATVVSASNQFAVGGSQVIAGTWSYLGGNQDPACTGAVATSGSLANNDAPTCSPGYGIGQVNGEWTCLPQSSTTPTSTTTTATKCTTVEGTETCVTTTTTRNNDGTQTTSTTSTSTSVNGGAPTSGGASTTSSPTGGVADKGDSDQAAFCKDNPDAPGCKASSFGGTCGAFSCDGDAVQCAIAKEQHTRNCALFDTNTDLATLGNAVAAGQDPADATMPWKAGNVESFDFSDRISTQSWLGGTCPGDKTINVGTWSFAIPFSKWCDILTIMGYIVVAFSMLAAARIVGITS
jgi:hypothetical protein